MSDPLEHHLLEQTDAPIGFWHRVRAQAVIDRIDSDSAPVVADIGAGAGSLGELLAEAVPGAGYRFHEQLDGVAAVLEAVHGADARMATIDDVSDATTVAVLDVIEHVEDDAGFVAAIAAAMAEEATLVVSVPALPALWSVWDEKLGHHRRYTRSTLRAVVGSDVPLELIEISYLFPELLPPAVFRRFRPSSSDAADFPKLPPVLDRLLYHVGLVTYRLRRLWPAGTSLLLVARRRPDPIPGEAG